ncbi:hypothetical protein [Thermococcus gorgonarius]|uniref:Uncharacterized protein n=1 Tax=Thermococcus gorgonarius TaxID=71997 RepID=A0A2Z2MB60_THEGO|nr:hypothetical protein [Thermococcus gorgonarius]ASJ01184.1 hypothetical protein A3K92_06655 [Thermococcus gorgonarius]
MKRAQITFDFLIAVMLITVTVAGIVSIASGEIGSARILDTTAKLKAFAVDLRDTAVKSYSVGTNFTIIKSSPIRLSNGDKITVKLYSRNSTILITAELGGKTFVVGQNVPVPLCDSNVELTPGDESFNVTAVSVGGRSCVTVKK